MGAKESEAEICKMSIAQVRELRDVAKDELNETLEKLKIDKSKNKINFPIGSKKFNFLYSK